MTTRWHKSIACCLCAAVLILAATLGVTAPVAAQSGGVGGHSLLIPAQPAVSARVHYLLIIDTEAEKIGATTRVDAFNVAKTLLKPLQRHGRLGSGRVLAGRSVTPAAVLRTLQLMQIGPNDTLLVYYTGHGTIMGGDHVLTMTHGNLRHSLLRRAVLGKRARLSVIMTDACATFTRSTKSVQPPEKGEVAKTGASVEADWNTIQSLFFGQAGLVDVNAAKPGEAALCTQGSGGLFTAALLQAARHPALFGNSNWRSLLGQVQQTLRQNGEDQHPYAFSLPR